LIGTGKVQEMGARPGDFELKEKHYQDCNMKVAVCGVGKIEM
jgi:hypothetical protein